MNKRTKAMLKKWSIRVGCTVTAGLLLQGWKSSDAFAVAHQKAVAAAPAPAADALAQDRVVEEWQSGKTGRAGSGNGRSAPDGQQSQKHGDRGQGMGRGGASTEGSPSGDRRAFAGGAGGSASGGQNEPQTSQQRTQPRSTTRAS